MRAVLLELTQRCDRACAHCYNVWRHDRSHPVAEIAPSELRSLAQRILTVFSPRTVTVMGGEPLLHEGCVELLGHLAGQGIEVALATHGGLVDSVTARSLSAAGVRAVEVSLCPEPAQACRALGLLEAQGIDCTASIVLARPFLAMLPELLERAAAFGAVGLSVHPLIEPFPGALARGLVPDEEQLAAALCEVAERSARAGMPALLSYPIGACRVPAPAAGIDRASCRCDGSRIVVDAAGNVRRCEADPAVMGDVFERVPTLAGPEPWRAAECRGCGDGSCRRPCRFVARPG